MEVKKDQFSNFRKLSKEFKESYYKWHTEGQYQGSYESRITPNQLWENPPARELDSYYATELEVIDRYYQPLKTASILEIGCGDGNLTWKLAQKCKILESWDVDTGAVELTKIRLQNLGCVNSTVKKFDIKDIDPKSVDKKYDIVFFIQVLEHIPGWDQEEYFRKVFSLVKDDGGVLFISTPNRWTFRDHHDTGKLFIHWLPRFVKVPIAKRFGFGLTDHDPSWPYPPILHDYVSFAWMKSKAKKFAGNSTVRFSRMEFYPTMDIWYRYKKGSGKGIKKILLPVLKNIGRILNINYYFGAKIIIQKNIPT